MQKCHICGKGIGIEEGDMCFECKHFTEIYWVNKPHTLQISGKMYVVGRVRPEMPKSWKGFGGRTFYIEKDSGEMIVTDNLWLVGELRSPELKRLFPDNAKFVDVECVRG